MSGQKLNRRTMLKAAGVSIGLPLLEAMIPVSANADQSAKVTPPKRMLLIGRPLGMHAPFFFPEKTGSNYEPSRYLKHLESMRSDFTVFSGMSHHHANAHGSLAGLMTGVSPDGMRPGDAIRNTISLDQEVAARIGKETRFASLSLGGGELSWNRKGMKVPSESQARQVFKELFINGTPDEVAKEILRLQTGASILDGVRNQASSLALRLGNTDRQRIDLLLTSIREAELRLQQDQAWVLRPKPTVAMRPITDDYVTGGRMLERSRQWFDLVRMALQTDSTRVVSLMLWSHETAIVDGMSIGHHDASHHGQDENKIKQLAVVEEAEMKEFANFLQKMRDTDEHGTSLLERTQIFYASNLGNASAHTCDNLPVILAGGGFRHAGHVAFDRKKNVLISNLFVRMLQQMDLEFERFGNSSARLDAV